MARPWRTLVAVLVAVTLVIVAIVWERASPIAGAGRARALGHEALFPEGLPTGEVTRITLDRRDAERLVYEKRGAAWQQVEPFPFDMDPWSIDQIVKTLAQLALIERLDEKELGSTLSVASLGLDPPLATLALEGAGGVLEIALGRRGLAGRAYLRLDGEQRVTVVDAALHERAIEMDPKEWRDRRLFPHAGPDALRIEIVGSEAGAEIVLVRDRKTWMLERPARTRMSELARDDLFQALARARCEGFVIDEPEDLSRFGLAEPSGSITVVAPAAGGGGGVEGEGEPIIERLLIGGRMGATTEDRFGLIEGRPVIVRIPAKLLRETFQSPARLAAATASGASPGDVKSIRVVAADGAELGLVRDLERWVAPDHDGREVPAARADALLQALVSVQASEIVFAPFPRDLEVATITLLGYGGRPIDTVRVAREASESGEPGAWILENGDGVLRRHQPSLELPLRASDYGLAEPPAG